MSKPTKRTMSLGWVLASWLRLSAALGHLHMTLGVLHGDLSAGNVLLDELGHACLADFGHAQPFSVSTEWPQRLLHGPATPAFAPPEHRERPPRSAGPPSDAFGLAAVMCVSAQRCRLRDRFYALTGRLPFRDDKTAPRAFACADKVDGAH